MRIKEGFILRRTPDMNLVMAAGKQMKEYHRMVVLNGTAAFLFEQLQKQEATAASLTDALLQEYEVDRPRAEAAVESVLHDFREAGILEE